MAVTKYVTIDSLKLFYKQLRKNAYQATDKLFGSIKLADSVLSNRRKLELDGEGRAYVELFPGNDADNTIGSNSKPIYINNGQFTTSTTNIGSSTSPIYMENGELKATHVSIGATDIPIFIHNGQFEASTTSLGNTLQPIYLKNGKFELCDDIGAVLDEIKQDKQDKLISGVNIKNINGESLLGEGNIQLQAELPVTYSELIALRNENKLIPGSKYRITDYKTTAIGDGVSITDENTQNKFNLIIDAISSNELSEEAELISDPVPYTNVDTSDINNWKECNPDDGRTFPSDFPDNMGHQYLSRTGLRPGQVLRIKYVGTTTLGTPTKGWGADLTAQGTATILAATFTTDTYYEADSQGYFYLILPPNINPDTKYSVHFFAEYTSNLSELSDGECGVVIDIINPVSSWKVKYCLDNDTKRFAWADTTNGKGVIYYMKDNLGNEAPYDFKNILFNGKYTFNIITNNKDFDASVATSNCKNNIIEEYVVNGIMHLPENIFELGSYSSVCWDNVFKGNSSKNILTGDICNYEISSEITGANLTCTVDTKNNSKIYTKTIVEKDLEGNLVNYKLQKELISGTNIKTINGKSLLGSGDIIIKTGSDVKDGVLII